MSPRAFIFSAWLASDKSAAKTKAALELIGANQHSMVKEGGRLLVSASMGGKSYSYSLPPDLTASTVSELALTCWALVKDMTDAELEAYLTRRNPKTMIAAFNYPLHP
jgi:hypothetical protein